MLSYNSKLILIEMLYDMGIKVDITAFNNYMIDVDSWEDLNAMHRSIVNNWGNFIIA